MLFSYFTKPPEDFMKSIRLLNKIPHINHGGCCLASLAIYKLAEQHGLKPQIVFLTDKDYIKLELERNWPSGTNHAMVKINHRYYDSTGSYNRFQINRIYNPKHICKVSYDLAKKSALDSRNWNDNFNRSHGLEQINNIMNIGIVVVKHNY